MSEYISRNEVYQKLHEAGGCNASDEWARGYDAGITEAIDIIDNIPSAAVAPVEHAHWIQANDIDETAWRCSKCDITWLLDEGTPSENEMRYCPKCGAYMIESEENDNV